MPFVCQHGALIQQCSNGGMVAVFAEETMLLPIADECELDLSTTNDAQHSVFSGSERQPRDLLYRINAVRTSAITDSASLAQPIRHY